MQLIKTHNLVVYNKQMLIIVWKHMCILNNTYYLENITPVNLNCLQSVNTKQNRVDHKNINIMIIVIKNIKNKKY